VPRRRHRQDRAARGRGRRRRRRRGRGHARQAVRVEHRGEICRRFGAARRVARRRRRRAASEQNPSTFRFSTRRNNAGAKTLATLFEGDRPGGFLDGAAPVAEAAARIARTRRAVLVGTPENVRGIVTAKDVLARVAARNVDPSTAVEAVMTPKPDVLRADATLLDALHAMHDNR
jgi:signal-transduction protein with cAMP-binding, CBS, and nucleotidyltransferase domain